MTLEEEVKQAYENFNDLSFDKVIDILKEIRPFFKSSITQDYLSGKLDVVTNTTDENEKKKLCLSLKPYFDWYLQGQ